MNTLNLRPVFSDQCAQCVIVDVANISALFLKNLIIAIQNVLTLACSVRGGIRIPAFALSVITKGITTVYELDSIRGNFNKIMLALNSLSSYCHLNENINTQEYKDSLYLAIESCIQSYKSKTEKNDWDGNTPQIEITVVTIKDCKTIRSYLGTFIAEMEVSNVHKITVIELYSEMNIIENSEEKQTTFIETLIMNADTHLQLEKFFKYWLIDQCKDINAVLHLPGTNIKCDIFECMLNPLSLPFGHRFYIQNDSLSVQLTGMSVAKTATSNIPVYELNIIYRVNASNVSNSSLFGLPLCLRPTQSWRLNLKEQQENEQHFSELCRQLSDGELVLLAQMKSHFQTDQFLPYFLLIPGDCCLLMKSFAPSDLALPWNEDNASQPGSVESSIKVFSSLQGLELLDDLDSNKFESGLLIALSANLKHAGRRDVTLDYSEPSTSRRNKRSK